MRALGVIAATVVVAVGCRTGRHLDVGAASSSGARSSDAPTRFLWLPEGRPRFIGRDPEGFDNVSLGRLRLQVRDDEVRVADDSFAESIAVAAHVARGWVFVAADGTSARADTFVGPLSVLGRRLCFGGTRDEYEANPQHGRIAVTDCDGGAWSSDGGDFERIAALGREPVQDVFFTSERHGAALTRDGVVRCTRDGGARWEVVPTGPVGARQMHVGPQGLSVYADEWRSLTPDCNLLDHELDGSEPGAGAALDYNEVTGRYDRENELPRLLLHHDPAWIDALQGLPLPDGTVVLPSATGARLLDANTAREVRSIPDESRRGYGEGQCRLDLAGYLLRESCWRMPACSPHGPCFDRGGSSTTYVDLRGARGRRVANDLYGPAFGRALAADDPDLAVALGRCDDTPPSDRDAEPAPTADALCEFTRASPAGRLRPLGQPIARLFGIAARRALVGRSDGSLATVDLTVPPTVPSAVTTALRVPPGQVAVAAIGASGVVTAAVREGVALRSAAVGRIGEPLQTVPLPHDVNRVVFADATHGFAWSTDFAHLHRTRDRGAHWEELPALLVTPTGDALPTEGDRPWSDREWRPDPLRCSLAHCRLDERLVVAGWGPVRPRSGRLFATPRTPVPETESGPVAPVRWLAPEQVPRLRCDVGQAAPLPPLGALAAPPRLLSRALSSRVLDGDVHAIAWSEGDHFHARFAWHGRDASGSFSATSAAVRLPGSVGGEGRPANLPRLAMRALAVGRSRAVVVMEQTETVYWRILEVPAGGEAVAVDTTATPGTITLAPMVQRSGGGFGLLVDATIMNIGDAFSMPASGSTLSVRRYQYPQPFVALAERGDERGVAFLLPGADLTFRVQRFDPAATDPTPLPWRAEGTLQPCTDARAADTWSLSIPVRFTLEGVAEGASSTTWVTLDARAEGACIRSAETLGPDGGVSVTASGDGALRGTVTRGESFATARCAVP